jgi:hypothetical protein
MGLLTSRPPAAHQTLLIVARTGRSESGSPRSSRHGLATRRAPEDASGAGGPFAVPRELRDREDDDRDVVSRMAGSEPYDLVDDGSGGSAGVDAAVLGERRWVRHPCRDVEESGFDLDTSTSTVRSRRVYGVSASVYSGVRAW